MILSVLLSFLPPIAAGWQVPSFEVADIRHSDPAVQKTGKGRMLPGGRIELPGQTLRDLVGFAYGLQDDMIVGAPKWAAQERFDIVAKAPSNAGPDMLRQMMKALLAERFQLGTHNEDRRTAAYVLTVAKTPGFHESSGGPMHCNWAAPTRGLNRRECRNVTMDEFARELPNTGGIGIFLPVKDETGLTGRYDFEFEVVEYVRPNSTQSDGPAPPDESGPSIFAALAKIGLRLDERKIMLPALVIDRAQPPAEAK